MVLDSLGAQDDDDNDYDGLISIDLYPSDAELGRVVRDESSGVDLDMMVYEENIAWSTPEEREVPHSFDHTDLEDAPITNPMSRGSSVYQVLRPPPSPPPSSSPPPIATSSVSA